MLGNMGQQAHIRTLAGSRTANVTGRKDVSISKGKGSVIDATSGFGERRKSRDKALWTHKSDHSW